MNNFVEIVDDLMAWPEAVLEGNGSRCVDGLLAYRVHLNKWYVPVIFFSRVIQSFETLANNLVQQENFTNVTIVEKDVAFVAMRVRQCIYIVCILLSGCW